MKNVNLNNDHEHCFVLKLIGVTIVRQVAYIERATKFLSSFRGRTKLGARVRREIQACRSDNDVKSGIAYFCTFPCSTSYVALYCVSILSI